MLKEDLVRTVDGWASLGNPCIWERFILRNGKPYSMRLLPTRERGPLGYCFANAADRFRKLGGEYVEGLAMTAGLIPLHHAWVGVDGVAFEVTWGARLMSGKPRTAEYLGVALTEEQLMAGRAVTETTSPFSDGFKFNTSLIYSIDPGLREIVEGVRQPATD